MNRRALIASAATAICAQAAPAAGDGNEITAAEKAWAAAVVKGDLAALDRILSPRLIYAHSTGVVETRKEYLGKLKAGTQRYDGIEHQSIQVEIYGDAAVAHSNVRMHGRSASGPFDNRLMMLHLWVKQAGRWQLAAHQTTRLS